MLVVKGIYSIMQKKSQNVLWLVEASKNATFLWKIIEFLERGSIIYMNLAKSMFPKRIYDNQFFCLSQKFQKKLEKESYDKSATERETDIQVNMHLNDAYLQSNFHQNFYFRSEKVKEKSKIMAHLAKYVLTWRILKHHL